MGLNREGYVLLALFVYLLVLLFSGFRLYGRSDGEPRGGTEGRLADALAYFGAGPLPLLLMGLPGLLLLDGWPRLAAGLSLALGCCLLPLLGGRLERAMERAQASTVYELLARTLGSPLALSALAPLLGLFGVFLLAGCVGLLAKLASSAFSLAYNIAVYFSGLLVLLLCLFSTPPAQRRHGRLLALVLPLCLIGLALGLALGGSLDEAASPAVAFSLTDLGADLCLGLGVLGSVPLLHALPRRRSGRQLLGFVALQAALWLLCLASLLILVLCLGGAAGSLGALASAETAYLLAAQDGFSSLASALLLLAPLAVGLSGGTGAGETVRQALEEGLCLCFPLLEGRKRRLAGLLALVLAAGLAVLLALRQEISVYQLYSAGWAGMAACLAPLLLAGLLPLRLAKPAYLLSPLVGAATVLAFFFTPSLSSVSPLAPALLLSCLAALPFVRPKPREEA